ncbi:hypothetical protein BDA99DRAFT_607617 [Phascolomyces articulosus]|uniref:Uncharacterized protein n=1 Tax=Phascolomyces articulosus TaxID=60185 RepID=A0AAD5K310_9FUNG|nr:hypothetical protein BDA99DRAFT_607617 [Phascolomyces articulosus]
MPPRRDPLLRDITTPTLSPGHFNVYGVETRARRAQRIQQQQPQPPVQQTPPDQQAPAEPQPPPGHQPPPVNHLPLVHHQRPRANFIFLTVLIIYNGFTISREAKSLSERVGGPTSRRILPISKTQSFPHPIDKPITESVTDKPKIPMDISSVSDSIVSNKKPDNKDMILMQELSDSMETYRSLLDENKVTLQYVSEHHEQVESLLDKIIGLMRRKMTTNEDIDDELQTLGIFQLALKVQSVATYTASLSIPYKRMILEVNKILNILSTADWS